MSVPLVIEKSSVFFALRRHCEAVKNSIADPAEVYFKKGLFEFYSIQGTLP
jgi:hypothetical protein